jgi:hypothetical protein
MLVSKLWTVLSILVLDNIIIAIEFSHARQKKQAIQPHRELSVCYDRSKKRKKRQAIFKKKIEPLV